MRKDDTVACAGRQEGVLDDLRSGQDGEVRRHPGKLGPVHVLKHAGIGGEREVVGRHVRQGLERLSKLVVAQKLHVDRLADLVRAEGEGEDGAVEAHEVGARRLRCDGRALEPSPNRGPESVDVGRNQSGALEGDQLGAQKRQRGLVSGVRGGRGYQGAPGVRQVNGDRVGRVRVRPGRQGGCGHPVAGRSRDHTRLGVGRIVVGDPDFAAAPVRAARRSHADFVRTPGHSERREEHNRRVDIARCGLKGRLVSGQRLTGQLRREGGADRDLFGSDLQIARRVVHLGDAHELVRHVIGGQGHQVHAVQDTEVKPDPELVCLSDVARTLHQQLSDRRRDGGDADAVKGCRAGVRAGAVFGHVRRVSCRLDVRPVAVLPVEILDLHVVEGVGGALDVHLDGIVSRRAGDEVREAEGINGRQVRRVGHAIVRDRGVAVRLNLPRPVREETVRVSRRHHLRDEVGGLTLTVQNRREEDALRQTVRAPRREAPCPA